MAPTKAKTGSSKGNNKRSSSTKSSKSGSSSSSKTKKAAVGPRPKPTQQKTKRADSKPQKKKKRVYTEKELGIPALNSIKPAGVQKVRGAKKGKTFVDDRESMMTILSMVQAEKEGNIESKMMRARQMEEIRAARKAEAEKKEELRKQKFQDVKDDLRKKRWRTKSDDAAGEMDEVAKPKKKKKVSFG